MVYVNCLHLTDLHLGMRGSRELWPNIEHEFYNDLEYVIREVGPLDLVLFTGDLVQSGSRTEFDEISGLLNRFWQAFAGLGSQPLLLTVPGNHDLVRPTNARNPSIITLRRLWNEREVQEPFWMNRTSAQRRLVNRAFANYIRWRENSPIRTPDEYSEGMLPGDFATSFQKQHVRIGILGLNSAFLQLTSEDAEGKMSLDVRQFHAACGGHGPDWIMRHDLCFLMTHHPPTWLTTRGQQELENEIHAPPERFAFHLFGHMHDTDFTSLSEGASHPRNRLQGPSLFGLEGWGTECRTRRHGYSVIQLRFDESAAWRIWPRCAEVKQAGGRRLDCDRSYSLARGQQATEWNSIELLHRRAATSLPNGMLATSALGEEEQTASVRSESDPRRTGVYAPNQAHVSSFCELCAVIQPLLEENKWAFRNFGPRSGAGAIGPVRWNLDLWKKARVERIVPNNGRIAGLLTRYRSLVPAPELAQVEAMLAHVYAFEKHCEDPSVVYSEHQFPHGFEDMVRRHSSSA